MDGRKRQTMMSLIETVNQHIRSHEISDFRIHALEGDTLRLVGSFDLSYCHDAALVLTGISWLDLPCYFWLDLSLDQPFSIAFPSEDTASLCFTDCGTQRRGEISFEGDLSLHIEHVSYTAKPRTSEDAP